MAASMLIWSAASLLNLVNAQGSCWPDQGYFPLNSDFSITQMVLTNYADDYIAIGERKSDNTPLLMRLNQQSRNPIVYASYFDKIGDSTGEPGVDWLTVSSVKAISKVPTTLDGYWLAVITEKSATDYAFVYMRMDYEDPVVLSITFTALDPSIGIDVNTEPNFIAAASYVGVYFWNYYSLIVAFKTTSGDALLGRVNYGRQHYLYKNTNTANYRMFLAVADGTGQCMVAGTVNDKLAFQNMSDEASLPCQLMTAPAMYALFVSQFGATLQPVAADTVNGSANYFIVLGSQEGEQQGHFALAILLKDFCSAGNQTLRLSKITKNSSSSTFSPVFSGFTLDWNSVGDVSVILQFYNSEDYKIYQIGQRIDDETYSFVSDDFYRFDVDLATPSILQSMTATLHTTDITWVGMFYTFLKTDTDSYVFFNSNNSGLDCKDYPIINEESLGVQPTFGFDALVEYTIASDEVNVLGSSSLVEFSSLGNGINMIEIDSYTYLEQTVAFMNPCQQEATQANLVDQFVNMGETVAIQPIGSLYTHDDGNCWDNSYKIEAISGLEPTSDHIILQEVTSADLSVTITSDQIGHLMIQSTSCDISQVDQEYVVTFSGAVIAQYVPSTVKVEATDMTQSFTIKEPTCTGGNFVLPADGFISVNYVIRDPTLTVEFDSELINNGLCQYDLTVLNQFDLSQLDPEIFTLIQPEFARLATPPCYFIYTSTNAQLNIYSDSKDKSGTYFLVVQIKDPVSGLVSNNVQFTVTLESPACLPAGITVSKTPADEVYTEGDGKLEIYWDDFDIEPDYLCTYNEVVYEVQETNLGCEDDWFEIDEMNRMITIETPQQIKDGCLLTFKVIGSVFDSGQDLAYSEEEFDVKVIIQKKFVPSIEIKVEEEQPLPEEEAEEEPVVEDSQDQEPLYIEPEEVKDKKPNKMVEKSATPIPTISDISPTGEVVVEFNLNLSVPDFTDLKSEVVAADDDEGQDSSYLLTYSQTQMLFDITLQSSETDQNFNISLTEYYLQDFTETEIVIKLVFNDPKLISTNAKARTKIDLVILDSKYFVAQSTNETIHESNLSGEHELPAMLTEADAQLMEAVGETVETSATLLSSTSFAVSLLLAFTLKYLWNIINLLQLLIFIPKWYVSFPANALMSVNTLKSLALLEFIPYDWLIDFINTTLSPSSSSDDNSELRRLLADTNVLDENTDEQETSSSGSSDETARQKIDLMDQLGIIIFFSLVMVIFFIFVFLLWLCHLMRYWVYKLYKSIHKKLFWNSILRYFFTAQLKLMVEFGSVFLILSSTSGEGSSGNSGKMLAAVIIFILFGILPIIQVIILKRNYPNINKPSTKSRIGTLYLNISTSRKLALYTFAPVFVIRRHMFIIITFAIIDYPQLQIMLLNVVNLLYCVYLAHVWPNDSYFGNYLDIVNEFLFTICILNISLFSQYIPDPLVRYEVGWDLLYMLIILIGYNFLVIIYMNGNAVYQKVKYSYKKRQYNKKLLIFAQRKEQLEKKLANLKIQENGDASCSFGSDSSMEGNSESEEEKQEEQGPWGKESSQENSSIQEIVNSQQEMDKKLQLDLQLDSLNDQQQHDEFLIENPITDNNDQKKKLSGSLLSESQKENQDMNLTYKDLMDGIIATSNKQSSAALANNSSDDGHFAYPHVQDKEQNEGVNNLQDVQYEDPMNESLANSENDPHQHHYSYQYNEPGDIKDNGDDIIWSKTQNLDKQVKKKENQYKPRLIGQPVNHFRKESDSNDQLQSTPPENFSRKQPKLTERQKQWIKASPYQQQEMIIQKSRRKNKKPTIFL